MTHAIDCPACGGHLKIPDGIWEKRVAGQVAHLNCKKCKHPIEVDGRSDEQKAAALARPLPPQADEPKVDEAPRPDEAPKPDAKAAEVAPEPRPVEPSKPDNPKPAVAKLALQPRRPEIRSKSEIGPKFELRGARADVTPRPITAKLPEVAAKPERGSKPEIAPKPDRGSKPDLTPKPGGVRGSRPDLTPKPDEITTKLPDVITSAPDVLTPKPIEPRALVKPVVPKLGSSPERATRPEIPKPAPRESTPDTPLAKLGIKSDPPPESIPADSADIIEIPPSEPLPRFPPPKPDVRATLPDRDLPKPSATAGKKPPPKPVVIREGDPIPSPTKQTSERPKSKPSERPKADRPKSERPKSSEEKRRSVRPVALDSTDRNAPVVAAEASPGKSGRGLTIALIVAAALAVGWWVLRPRAAAPEPARPHASPPAPASVAPSATPTPTRAPIVEESPTPPTATDTPPAAESAESDEPKKDAPKKRRSVTPPGTRYVPSSI